MAVDPRRLLIFRAIARAGSLTAGARALGWTQPAVSQHMTRLEREIGTPVFVRTTRGVTLTEAGRSLLRRADEIAALLGAAEAEMADFTLASAGRVRLIAHPSALATLIPRALATLATTHPGVEVALSEAEPPEAIEALRAGDADVAITFRYEHESTPAGTAVRVLDTEPVRLALPRVLAGRATATDSSATNATANATATVTSLSDLADAVWVGGCERCRSHLQRICATAGFTPRIRHTTDDYVVVQALVAQGLAVAVLPASSLSAHRHPDIVEHSVPGLGVRTIEALTLPGVTRVPSVAALLDALAAGQQPHEGSPG